MQNDFHQNWEFKFKFNLNKLRKGIQIRLMPRENEDKNKLSVYKNFSKKKVQNSDRAP